MPTITTPTIRKTYLKSIMVLSFLLMIICTQSLFAQDLNFIGKSQEEIEKMLLSDMKIFKNKKNKIKHQFNYKLKSAENSEGNKITYLEKNLISYRMPYFNTSSKLFINKNGYCDSIIFYENVCTDCAVKEDSATMSYSFFSWQKLSKNQYKSEFAFLLPNGQSKKSEKQYSYVRLVRNEKPETGECRIYTLTLEEPMYAKDLMKYKKPKSVPSIYKMLKIKVFRGA